jgi:hypothetical protein
MSGVLGKGAVKSVLVQPVGSTNGDKVRARACAAL